MHLRARLDEATLRTLLDELLPLTILLDTDADDGGRAGRWIRIEPATKVDFVAGQGLRLAAPGQIRWITKGLVTEWTLHAVQILLRPEIVANEHGGKLLFRPTVEIADVKNLPGFVDRGISALINNQLAARADEMSWDFGKSLGLVVPLPPMLEGVSTLALDVRDATVQVSDDAVELGVTMSIDFLRAPAGASST
jgi:hypothetical protein